MMVMPTAYLGPVSYYARLFHEPEVMIEACEHYVKQTLRNRCLIATNQGGQTLTVSVAKGNRPQQSIREVLLSDHANWMHQHLYSLATYYGASPFYEYYIDDIREVFFEAIYGTAHPSASAPVTGSLFDLNEKLRQRICELIGFEPRVRYSEQWMGPGNDSVFVPQTLKPYYQIAGVESRQPFQSDMSILDLLFNMGPESILVLNEIRY